MDVLAVNYLSLEGTEQSSQEITDSEFLNAVNQLYENAEAVIGRQKNKRIHAPIFRREVLKCVKQVYSESAGMSKSLRAQTDNSPNVSPGLDRRTVVRNCVNEALTNNVSSTRAEQKADTLLEDIYLEARKYGNQEATPNLSTSQLRPTQHVESVTDQSLVTEVTEVNTASVFMDYVYNP